MPDPYAPYVYAIAWAAGAALLAFLMHVGKLPSVKTGLAVRVLMAAAVSAMLVAAVYGAQHLDRRAQALQRRRHEAARSNLASAKRAAGAAASTTPTHTTSSRAGAAGPQVATKAYPQTRARVSAAAPSQRSAAARSSLLGTIQHGARNAAALMRGTRAGSAPQDAPTQIPIEQGQQEEEEVPPAPTEAELDAEHDRAQSMKTAGTGMVGEVRESAFSARIRPRRTEAAEQWLDPETTTPGARKLAEILTFDGMRQLSDTTLYAREAYKTHQWNEPGEGMDQRYVDPSLTSYDPAFTAYSEQPFVDQRSTLSTRAPAAF